MNYFKLLLCFVASICAALTVPLTEASQITNMLNNYRSIQGSSDMQYVSYNSELAQDVDAFLSTKEPGWIFNNGSKNVSSWPGFALMNQEPFKSKYPGYNFVIHDTCAVYVDNVLFIHKFRLLQQEECMNFHICSNIVYTDFATCTTKVWNIPGQKCSWAPKYTNLYISTLSEYAVSLIKFKGPYSPKGQPLSFWSFGKYVPVTSDVPFHYGTACSQCLSGMSMCRNKLCVNYS